jgi:chemotaxis-related protein WspD
VNSLPTLPSTTDCWNQIGVRGDHTCPELLRVVHCHNCPVFAAAGRRFLDAPSPPGYLEEWTQRLAALPEERCHDSISVLIFRLGEEWLALPVQVLVEVTSLRPVHRIPHRGGVLAGLVNIRGELHLCVRLDLLLGIPSQERAVSADHPGVPSRRLLVVGHKGEDWVFAVDEVDQVQRFAAAELTRAPATLQRSSGHLTRGVFVTGQRSVGYLDEERFFQTLRTRLR